MFCGSLCLAIACFTTLILDSDLYFVINLPHMNSHTYPEPCTLHQCWKGVQYGGPVVVYLLTCYLFFWTSESTWTFRVWIWSSWAHGQNMGKYTVGLRPWFSPGKWMGRSLQVLVETLPLVEEFIRILFMNEEKIWHSLGVVFDITNRPHMNTLRKIWV